MDMQILYEDNHLLIAVKPVNIPSQGDPSGDADMLTLLKAYIKEKYNKPGEVYLGLVHRLDRPAGGVMAFARTSKAAARLSAQFAGHGAKKRYLAVLCGEGNGGSFADYIRKEANGTASLCDEGAAEAKAARLSYAPLAYTEGLTLADVSLQTGRHHQIRVQFAHLGLPLYGDARYNPRAKPGEQLALWAASLSFPHPVTKETVLIEKEPPGIFPWTVFEQKTVGFSMPVLFEDGRLLAVDKPAGMEVEEKLTELVNARFPSARPCHRLDANTTGVTLFALTDKAYEEITQGMEKRSIEKVYRCVVKGAPEPAEKICRAWLKKDPEAAKVAIFDKEVSGAKEIITEYRVEERFADTSILSVKLVTGRTHQIRAHLAHLGHPILGDDKYGDREFNKSKGQKIQLLRAVRAVIRIPGYGMTIEAPKTF